MLEGGKISGRQFTGLIFLIIISITILQIPQILVGIAGRDSWLSIVIAFAIDGIVAAVLYFMGLRYPGKTFIQYSEEILGKIPGKITAIIFILFFLHIATISLRALADFLATLMPETPLEMFIIAQTLVSVYIARKGLEVLSRMGEIIVPIYIISILVLLVLIIPEAEPGELLPLFEFGILPAIKGSFLPASWFGVCIIMGIFMAYHNQPQKTFVVKMTGVLLGCIILILLITALIVVFGVQFTEKMTYPVFLLTRQISLADIVERVEILWGTIWLMAGFITICSLHYAAALGTAQVCSLNDYQVLVLPLGTVMAALSLRLSENTLQAMIFSRDIFPFYALSIEGGLTTLLFVVALVKLFFEKASR